MLSATDILDVVRDFLDGADWSYDYEADRNLIRSGFQLKNRLKAVNIFVTARDGILQTYVVPRGITADTANCTELLKFINWANWNMTSGNFEIDLSDGEIRFRYTTRLGSADSMPEDVAEGSIIISVMMYEKYGDSIAALAFGFSDADTEIQKIEAAEAEE